MSEKENKGIGDIGGGPLLTEPVEEQMNAFQDNFLKSLLGTEYLKKYNVERKTDNDGQGIITLTPKVQNGERIEIKISVTEGVIEINGKEIKIGDLSGFEKFVSNKDNLSVIEGSNLLSGSEVFERAEKLAKVYKFAKDLKDKYGFKDEWIYESVLI